MKKILPFLLLACLCNLNITAQNLGEDYFNKSKKPIIPKGRTKEIKDSSANVITSVPVEEAPARIPKDPPPSSRKFVLYNFSGTAPFGFMIGKEGGWGYYASVRTNGSFKKGEYMCDDESLIDYDGDGYYEFTDEVRRSRFSIQGGVNHRFSGLMTIYAGAGYGFRHLLWNVKEYSYETDLVTDEFFADYKPYMHQGVEVEAGVLFFFKSLTLSIGINTMAFKQFEITGGVGIVIK